MARTASTMLPLGTSAPDFSLMATDGNRIALADFQDAPALLVAFISNHCPYVKHIRAQFAALGNQYQARGVAVIAIGSNDGDAYPDDNFAAMQREKAQAGYLFSYAHDADQSVAKNYRAACTPDFFVFDGEQKLVYRGQMDGARPHNDEAPSGRDLRAALDAILENRAVSPDQKPSLGCNIKWQPGNAPDYF